VRDGLEGLYASPSAAMLSHIGVYTTVLLFVFRFDLPWLVNFLLKP
jgi:hypothetical protein